MNANRSERAQDLSGAQPNTEAAQHTTSARAIDRENEHHNTMTSHKETLNNELEDDSASTIAQSTIGGYAPSYSSGRRPLIATGRRQSDGHDLRKTTGRRAYLGACKALDLVIPIDYNEDKRSMHESSFAKLARTLKK